MSESTPRIRDLVQRALEDDAFAARVLNDPSSVASEYGLSSSQVAKIKDLADQGLFRAPVEAHGATPEGAYYF